MHVYPKKILGVISEMSQLCFQTGTEIHRFFMSSAVIDHTNGDKSSCGKKTHVIMGMAWGATEEADT